MLGAIVLEPLSKPLWMWVVFFVIVLTLLLVDLGVFHRTDRKIGVKESLVMSGFYMLMAFFFGLWIWHQLGAQSFFEYLTGYLVEKSLSLDNIFLISLIFSSLAIPTQYQHRVLFWGILGVIVLRAIMIAGGVELTHRFGWSFYFFSVFMIVTGVKMFFVSKQTMDISNNRFLQWMRKHLRITETFYGQRFLVRQLDATTGKKHFFMTPLFVALILIEAMDFVFAIDSIPAILTITTDPYLIYTSNIFAILGLRALYFALAFIMERFYYLKFSLALILVFMGSKIFIADFMHLEKFPPFISLGITVGLLGFGCLYSVYKKRIKNLIG